MADERPWSNIYPDSLNDDVSMPDLEDYVVTVRASHFNAMKGAIQALEAFMGKTASPAAGSCRKRLTDLEATSSTDEKVKVTTDDTTQGFLDDKLVVASGLTKSTLNPSGNEQMQIELTGLQYVEFNEEQFVTTGGETPGVTVTHSLTNTPIASSNSLSNKAIDVYRNGRRMEYDATPATYEQYFYNAGANRIEILAAGEEDEYEVCYLSGVAGGAVSFLGLDDTPGSFGGAGGHFVKVNPGATALEFSDVGGVSTFVGLSDTPGDLSASQLFSLRVNAAGDEIEFQKHNMAGSGMPSSVDDDIDAGYTIGSRWYDLTNDKEYVCLDNTQDNAVWVETTGGGDFVTLSDTPADYTAKANWSLRVNSVPDGIEFQKHKMDGTGVPSSVDDDIDAGYTIGSRWYDLTNDKEYVCLDNTQDNAVWVETTGSGGASSFTGLSDTPADYTNKAYFSLRVNNVPNGIEFQKHNMDASGPPAVTNDGPTEGYSVGSRWFDITNDKEYVCLDSTDDAAVWMETTQGGGGSLDTSYDFGGAGVGRSVDVDSGAIELNADGNAALKLSSTSGLGSDEGLQEITHTQTADDQPSIKVNHDFNSQNGTAFEFNGAISGDGIPASGNIRFLKATISKKVSATYYYYLLVANGQLWKKEGAGAWASVGLPADFSDPKIVKGSALDNIWVCGVGTGNVGYIAVDEGSGFARVNGHPTFGTHPLDGVACGLGIYGVIPVDKTEIWTLARNGNNHYVHKWTPGGGWVEKLDHSSTVGSAWLSRAKKTGGNTYVAFTLGQNIYYSGDDGDTWGNDSTFVGNNIMIHGNPATGRFRVVTYDFATTTLYDGLPGGVGEDAWTVVNSTTDMTGSANNTGIYVAPDGSTFTTFLKSSTEYFIHSWETTPVVLDTGNDWAGHGLDGSSKDNVTFCTNSDDMQLWNGSSLSLLDSGAASNGRDTWALEVLTGTGDFDLIECGYSGSSGDNNRASLVKGKDGLTHIIHSDSGAITLKALTEDPPEESGYASIFPKVVGGRTEWFARDDDNHIMQITNNNFVGGGAADFVGLSDTPANYTSEAYSTLRVNSAANAVEFQRHKMDATVAPTVDNDLDENYSVGSRWIDVTNDKEYVCLDNTQDNAVWIETTQSGGGGGGGTHKSEQFATTGGETPDTIVVIGTLTGTPGANANMPGGYDLAVYYDGVRMKYNASPSDYNEFSYNNGTKEISVYATGTIVDYDVDFWE